MAAYLYDPSGLTTWLAAGPTAMSGSIFSSALKAYSGGQTLTGWYNTPTSNSDAKSISITFSDLPLNTPRSAARPLRQA